METKKRRSYSKSDDEFILNTVSKYDTRDAAFIAIAKVLNSRPSAISSRYYTLRRMYVKTPVVKKQTIFQRFLNLFK